MSNEKQTSAEPISEATRRDITERSKVDEEINGLAKFPSENPNPVIRVLADGKILYHNKASTLLLDFWSCQTTKILPNHYLKTVSDVLSLGLNSVVKTEINDHIISLTFVPIIEEGYVNIYGMDITERTRADENILRVNESLENLVFERTKKLKEYNGKLLREITRHELAKERSETILRTALDCFWLVDIQGKLLEVNDAYCNLTGYSSEELLNMCISDVEALETPEETKEHIQQIIKTGSDRFESKHRCKDGRIIYVEVSTNYLGIEGGRFFSFIRDITEQKKSETLLLEQKKSLELKNIALSEILGQIEIEKKQIKDNVIANAQNLLVPVIQKLRITGESRKYVQLLQRNLQEITSSFGTKLTESGAKLTPRELEICNMVKNGLTNKEIAKLLNISLGTTERHRFNIRRKLGIVNKDISLSHYLKTI